MLRTLLCDRHNRFLVVEDAEAISELIRRKDHQLWLDLENPSPEEFRMLEDEFSLHPLAIEDARVRHQRPKIDQYSNFYFVVFYSVELDEATAPQVPSANPVRRGLRGTRFHGPEGGRAARIPNARYEPGSLVATEPETPNRGPRQDALASVTGVNETQNALAGGQQPDHIVLQEISMFMGQNYLVTVHEQPIPELDEVARRWYRNVAEIRGEAHEDGRPKGTRPLTEAEASALEPSEDNGHPMILTAQKTHTVTNGREPGSVHGDHAFRAGPDEADETSQEGKEAGARTSAGEVGVLLYSLLDTIVDGYFPVIDTIVDRIEDLEEQIFEHFNQAALESVFNLKKDLLAMRKVLAPERDVLNILTRRDLPIFDQQTLVYFQDVYDHVTRITDSIDTYRDLLSSALDSFLSMQSNRLNITVQTLTSVSIILMTISTFTGWFGMNFQYMNELHYTWSYPALIVVVATLVVLEGIFFKRKGWL